MRRIIRIVTSPREEWQRIAGEGGLAAIAYASLLSVLPAGAAFAMREGSDLALSSSAVGVTYAAFLGGIVLLGAAFRALAAFHDKRSTWAACFKVAAYGATPVLLAGAVLVHPVLVIVPMVALLHVFYLHYLGVQIVLGIAAEDSAMFVALAMAAVFVVSSVFGAGAASMALL